MANKAKQDVPSMHETVALIPVTDLVPHPDNPRTVRLDEEFLESVRAVGVIEPLTTRDLDGQLQVLSGHRRQAEIKAMSNADLLDELLCVQQGDDWDGGFTKRGVWIRDRLEEELRSRLSEWLKGAKSQ